MCIKSVDVSSCSIIKATDLELATYIDHDILEVWRQVKVKDITKMVVSVSVAEFVRTLGHNNGQSSKLIEGIIKLG